MPHQCIHCGKLIESASSEIIEGCNQCKGKFFFYIRDEVFNKYKETSNKCVELSVEDKIKVEEDVRDILNLDDADAPVILDIESIRISAPGKFEIDLVSLFNRKPIIFKMEEGKYIIDIDSGLRKKK